MNDFICNVKKKLQDSISEICADRVLYVRNPNRDFIRNRKWGLEKIIHFVLSIGGKSLGKEILDFFDYNENLPSVSAFCQQRSKLKPEAFYKLFRIFTDKFFELKCMKGYRILAADGSQLYLPDSCDDPDTFHGNGENKKGYFMFQMEAIYDVLNHLYIDACACPVLQASERQMLRELLISNPMKMPSVLILDRGYESYSLLSFLDEQNIKYLIRVRRDDRCILSHFNPGDGNDMDIHWILGKKDKPDPTVQKEIYKRISDSVKFEKITKDNPYYDFKTRLVCIELPSGEKEYLLTSLTRNEFSTKEIDQLYRMRWGIETSFRMLKYVVELNQFHTKKAENILQEIYARLTVYNYCELITTHIAIKQDASKKYNYQIDFTQAFHICRHYFRSINISPPTIEVLIRKYIQPIRKDRHYSRKSRRTRPNNHFIYRVS